jgi:hypothetical protein
MRKALVLVAVIILAFAGILIGAPKATHNAQWAVAITGLDIVGITQGARDLPEQSYPAH